MSGSTIGKVFSLTSFGESHGVAIGGIVQGAPANEEIDTVQIQNELDKRRPGQSEITTSRKEGDKVEFLSGLLNGKTTGAPIAFVIQNFDQKSSDYDEISDAFRPSHADFTYLKKYGIRDHRGGGRSSARETACRIVAGSIAKQLLEKLGVQFSTYVCQVGPLKMNKLDFYSEEEIEKSIVRCPKSNISNQMISLIKNIKEEGDTIGGAINCIIEGTPIGLGEPVFDKLHADLGKAMLSINAVKGFEIGSGFSGITMKGSQHNDFFTKNEKTKTNNSGGIQGGISNGMPIQFRVAFKPVSTINQEQETINNKGELVKIKVKGRHDPCVVPRAVPIVESMAAIIICDFYLRNKSVFLR